MIVKRFSLDDVQDITCAADFYKALGYDDEAFRNKDVFGNKAYYKNFFITPRTDEALRNIMHGNIDKVAKKVGSKTRARISQHMDWFNYAPVCNGERYDEIASKLGRINNDTLYILQKGDYLYEEAPDV